MGRLENLQSTGFNYSGPPDDLVDCVDSAINEQIADEIDTGILTDAEYVADNIFDVTGEYVFDPISGTSTPEYPEAIDDLYHLKLAFVCAVYKGENSVTLPISPAIAEAINALLTSEAASRITDRLNSDNRF